MLSIAVSRTVEINMALHYYGTGRRNYKLFVLMGMSIAASMLSLFVTSMLFDIIASVGIMLISVNLVGKELIQTIQWSRK